MTCFDIVVDSKWTLNSSTIGNFRMACYDVVVDSEWIVDLLSDL